MRPSVVAPAHMPTSCALVRIEAVETLETFPRRPHLAGIDFGPTIGPFAFASLPGARSDLSKIRLTGPPSPCGTAVYAHC